jgi:glutamyl-Q tRNA(Asp) synthetase
LILQQLANCGLVSDREIIYQSQRSNLYHQYAQRLEHQHLLYACACSRKTLSPNADLPYDRKCHLLNLHRVQDPLASVLDFKGAIRIQTHDLALHWQDRRLGPQAQDLQKEVGVYVITRRDGIFSYQLAVVVDDIEQSITDVVRGEDLCDNTARQMALYQALNHPLPQYLHLPLVKNEWGQKLSKQTLAPSIESTQPLSTLCQAAHFLGLQGQATSIDASLKLWQSQWVNLFPRH